MKLTIFFFIFLFTAIASTSETKLLLTGSSTVAPIMQDVALAFESENKERNVEIQTGGSTKGIIDVRRKLSDLGMISRSLKENEKDLSYKVIAYDGLGVIVHAKNSVRNISKQQLVGIYTQKITNWKQLGGKDIPIVVVNKAEGRSTLELFLKYTGLKNSQIKPHIVIGDNQQGIKTVAGSEHAIGYVSVGAATYNVKTGSTIQLLSLEGIKANIKNIKSKKYPILRSLNLVYKAPLSPKAKALMAFATSEKIFPILEKHYVIKP